MTVADIDTLRAAASECCASLSYIADSAEDNENPPALIELLMDLRDVKQAAAEAYKAVEDFLLKLDLPRQWETPVGVVEVKRATSRKAWRNDDLWHDVRVKAEGMGCDPLAVLADCARPDWRVEPLRAIGIDPSDYCIETPGAKSLRLPPRDIAERGKAA